MVSDILVNIHSDNGLSPGWCQAIAWTNVGLLWIGHKATNIRDILINIWKFSFKNVAFETIVSKTESIFYVSICKWNPLTFSGHYPSLKVQTSLAKKMLLKYLYVVAAIYKFYY